MDLKGKRVLVYGTGRSGIGAADLIAANGALPVLFDEKKADEAVIRTKLKMPEKAAFLLGNETLTDEEIQKIDLVVMSPGVPLEGADKTVRAVQRRLHGNRSGAGSDVPDHGIRIR